MLHRLFTLNQRAAALAVLLVAGLASAAEKPRGSAAACAGCHASQSQTQPDTSMGRALQPLGGANPILASHPRLTFQKFGYTYLVETKNGQSTYSVSDGTKTISLPIRWSFGNGGQTWMFERDGVYYESLVSYYPSVGGLDITTGDGDITPTTLEQAVGRKLAPNEPKACFGCHTTGAVVDGQLNLSSFEPGVTCEHCHVGSTAHLLSASQGDVMKTAPPELGKLSSEDLSNFCGRCHRSWEEVVRSPWRGEINVRFQPYRLANSQCFKGTDPRISCIACHDPHKELMTNIGSYDAKCLACHAIKGASAASAGRTSGKACPTATNNCATCHMPEVKIPNGLATFHDHQIRIVKPGMPYPN